MTGNVTTCNAAYKLVGLKRLNRAMKASVDDDNGDGDDDVMPLAAKKTMRSAVITARLVTVSSQLNSSS